MSYACLSAAPSQPCLWLAENLVDPHPDPQTDLQLDLGRALLLWTCTAITGLYLVLIMLTGPDLDLTFQLNCGLALPLWTCWTAAKPQQTEECLTPSALPSKDFSYTSLQEELALITIQ